MATTRTLANIKRPHYKVYHRTPAVYTRPTTAGNFTTFLATFTEMGYCRDKTIKITLDPADKEVIDTGGDLPMGYNGHLEFLLLQTNAVDYTEYETIEGVAQDLFFHAEVSDRCIFVPNAMLTFKEAVVSGETETIQAEWNATNLPTKAAFRDRFAEPQT